MTNEKQMPSGQNDPKAVNQGEGDRESARRYNESAQEFVNSPRGRSAIDDAGNVDADELEALHDTE